MVRFDCTPRKRFGRYGLVRLAARYGPEQGLDGLRLELGHTCSLLNERPGPYEPRCSAWLSVCAFPLCEDLAWVSSQPSPCWLTLNH